MFYPLSGALWRIKDCLYQMACVRGWVPGVGCEVRGSRCGSAEVPSAGMRSAGGRVSVPPCGEPAHIPGPGVVPRPPGCPAAPPRGRCGASLCPPAARLSVLRYTSRKESGRPCGPAPLPEAPRFFCSQAPKRCVSTLDPLRPSVPTHGSLEGHQQAGPSPAAPLPAASLSSALPQDVPPPRTPTWELPPARTRGCPILCAHVASMQLVPPTPHLCLQHYFLGSYPMSGTWPGFFRLLPKDSLAHPAFSAAVTHRLLSLTPQDP